MEMLVNSNDMVVSVRIFVIIMLPKHKPCRNIELTI
jgi:hypothetical protein